MSGDVARRKQVGFPSRPFLFILLMGICHQPARTLKCHGDYLRDYINH